MVFIVKVKEDMTGWIMSEHGIPDSRLTIIKQAEDYIDPKGRRFAKWLCQCNCGSKPFEAKQSGIKDGTTRSCGCLHKEVSQDVCRKNRHKTNEYDLSGDYGIGFATNNDTKFYFDLEDYELIKDYCWSTCEPVQGYVRIETTINNKGVNMAQLLTGKNDIDHIDRNPMNNRRINLREATRSQQAMNRKRQSNNTSGFIGVYLNKKNNKWFSTIKIDGNTKYLGSFIDKNDAIIKRLQAEVKYFGTAFAPQRHLFTEYGVSIE